MATGIRSFASISILELLVAAFVLMGAAAVLTAGQSGSLQDESTIVQLEDETDFG